MMMIAGGWLMATDNIHLAAPDFVFDDYYYCIRIVHITYNIINHPMCIILVHLIDSNVVHAWLGLDWICVAL